MLFKLAKLRGLMLMLFLPLLIKGMFDERLCWGLVFLIEEMTVSGDFKVF